MRRIKEAMKKGSSEAGIREEPGRLMFYRWTYAIDAISVMDEGLELKCTV